MGIVSRHATQTTAWGRSARGCRGVDSAQSLRCVSRRNLADDPPRARLVRCAIAKRSLKTSPVTPAVFVGRAAEIERISRMLARVSVAVIYGVPGVGKSSLAQAVARKFDGRVVFYKASSAPLAVLLDDIRRQIARGPV